MTIPYLILPNTTNDIEWFSLFKMMCCMETRTFKEFIYHCFSLSFPSKDQLKHDSGYSFTSVLFSIETATVSIDFQNPKSSLGPILAVESALEETKHTTEASTPQASGNWWPFADDGELPSDVKATWVETPRETGPWMSTHPVSMAFAR